jgi:hypothetical protein
MFWNMALCMAQTMMMQGWFVLITTLVTALLWQWSVQMTVLVLPPLKVSFNSSKSYDYDEDDQLKYEWEFEGGKVGSTEAKSNLYFPK